jgi:hypothetical protein
VGPTTKVRYRIRRKPLPPPSPDRAGAGVGRDGRRGCAVLHLDKHSSRCWMLSAASSRQRFGRTHQSVCPPNPWPAPFKPTTRAPARPHFTPMVAEAAEHPPFRPLAILIVFGDTLLVPSVFVLASPPRLRRRLKAAAGRPRDRSSTVNIRELQ